MTRFNSNFDPNGTPQPRDLGGQMGQPHACPQHVPVRIPGEIIDTIDIPSDGRQPGHRIYVVREPSAPKRVWPKLIALGLFLIAALFTLRHLDSVKAFFAIIENAGNGDRHSDIKGLLAVGFLGALLVAIVRICVRSEPPRGKDVRGQ